MTSNNLITSNDLGRQLENVLINGDLSALSAAERVQYYRKVCEVVGLNPVTKPFAYITLQGKLTLYALKAATDQLRKIHRVSIVECKQEQIGDMFVVTVKAEDSTGRTDVDTGILPIVNLKGDMLANQLMKTITKAKRRVTLSICGLGMLDESELDTMNVNLPKDLQKMEAVTDAMNDYIEALSANAPAADSYGEVLIEYGKFNKRKFREVGVDQITNYYDWLEGKFGPFPCDNEKMNKFAQDCQAYLESEGVA